MQISEVSQMEPEQQKVYLDMAKALCVAVQARHPSDTITKAAFNTHKNK